MLCGLVKWTEMAEANPEATCGTGHRKTGTGGQGTDFEHKLTLTLKLFEKAPGTLSFFV